MKALLRIESLQRSFSTTRYRLRYGSYMIPHPDKVAKGGEDACYASDNLIAVADGVGGWADHGIDPGLYSKKLIELMKEMFNNPLAQKTYINSPQSLIGDAVKKNKEVGTTTICVLSLDE